MNKKILVTAVATLLIGGGSGFFAGTKYQASKTRSRMPQFSRENAPGQINSDNQRTGGGFRPVNGTVIGRDDTGITVKMTDDSSKIILLTDSTIINKTQEGSVEDLAEGTEVMIVGQENSDGSVTAQNIQIGSEFPRNQEMN